MANVKVELRAKYMTAPQVQKRLCLGRYQLDIRIARGVLSKPTLIVNNVRYFDEAWVQIAKATLLYHSLESLRRTNGRVC